MKLRDYLKSKTVWAGIFAALSPFVGVYGDVALALAAVLGGVGVKSAIVKAGENK